MLSTLVNWGRTEAAHFIRLVAVLLCRDNLVRAQANECSVPRRGLLRND